MPYETILVAFAVEGATVSERHERLVDALVEANFVHDTHLPIDSWWVASDHRTDGSDNDSAVFVPMGWAHTVGTFITQVRELAVEQGV